MFNDTRILTFNKTRVYMSDKDKILKKFNDKETKFTASKVIDAYYVSEKTGSQMVTDFLTPSFMSQIILELEKEFGIYGLKCFGGYENAERRCIIFDNYDQEVNDIIVLKIAVNTKFNKELEHRAVLGSVLGLGLNRSKIGDIIFEGESCYLFVKKDVSDFILYNLEYVGRSKVIVSEVEYVEKKSIEEDELFTTTVSSMRIDTVISNITNFSRSEVKKLFEKELVFVNWKVCNNSSYTLKEQDLITVRKYGRIRIVNVRGFSKKGKQIIEYNKS